MLHDWKRQSLTNASLIGWLEQQPAAAEYDYKDNSACPLAQYFIACGYQDPIVGSVSFTHGAGNERWHNDAALPAAWVTLPQRSPWTFGAMLERVRALEATAMQHDADTKKAGQCYEAGASAPVDYY